MMESFDPLLLIGVMGLMLALGLLCRAYIPFFQRFLVPASIIGGLAGFGVVSFGCFGLKPDMFKLFAFHLFNASFIALGLTSGGNRPSADPRGKTILRGSLWLGLTSTLLLTTQGILGAGVTHVVNLVTGSDNYVGLGMLLAHGFMQGPGQAMAIGGAWQHEFGIPDAQTIALTFSAVGFLIASFVGVPLANWGVRRGFATHPTDTMKRDFLTGIRSGTDRVAVGRETVHPSNIGTLSLHLALIAAVYLANYGVCEIISKVFAGTPLGSLAFGFFFVWGLFTAMLIRKVVNMTGHGFLIDDDQMRQLTGVFVDFLMIATMMAISISVFVSYLALITTAVVICGTFTFCLVLYFGRRIGQYDLERMLVLFGSSTGTIPSGLVLLRIVDPGFKTTAAVESGAAQLVMIVAMMHIIVIAGVLPQSYTIVQAVGIWGATALVSLVMLRLFKVYNREKSF